MIGDQVRAAREAKGWSLREVARRCPINPGYLSQIEHGTRLPSPYMLAKLNDVLGVELALPGPVTVQPVPVSLNPEAPGILADLLATQRRLEDAVGATPLVPSIAAQLRLVTGLVIDSRGSLRRQILDVAAQWATFTGWLHVASGQHRHAAARFNDAADWSAEAGNNSLSSSILAFKAYAAGKRGDLAAKEGLAAAARRVPGVHPAQQAYNAFAHARAHAALGNRDRGARLLEVAADLIDAAMREGEPPPWAYWYTPAFFKLNIGLTHAYLGRHNDARDLISAGLGELPADQRGAEWTNDFRVALNGQ